MIRARYTVESFFPGGGVRPMRRRARTERQAWSAARSMVKDYQHSARTMHRRMSLQVAEQWSRTLDGAYVVIVDRHTGHVLGRLPLS